jgi:hypothetical protein
MVKARKRRSNSKPPPAAAITNGDAHLRLSRRRGNSMQALLSDPEMVKLLTAALALRDGHNQVFNGLPGNFEPTEGRRFTEEACTLFHDLFTEMANRLWALESQSNGKVG